MTDNTELKRLAEACQNHQPLRYMRSHGALYIRNDNGIVFDVHQNRSFPEFIAQNRDYADLVLAANPTAVLALIAENERLQQREQDLSASVKYWFNACGGKQFEAGVKHADEAASKYIDEHWRRQRDQLRAENAGLRTGYEAYERVNAELKAEVEGLRKALTSSREFLMRDAKVRRMTDGARHISPMFPLRKLVMEQIDAALGQGEQS